MERNINIDGDMTTEELNKYLIAQNERLLGDIDRYRERGLGDRVQSVVDVNNKLLENTFKTTI